MFFRNINLLLLKKSSSCYFQASISIWPSSTSVPPTEMEILLWFPVLNSLLSWSDSAYSKSLSTWVRIILTINALFFGPPSFFFFFPCPWGLQNYRKKKILLMWMQLFHFKTWMQSVICQQRSLVQQITFNSVFESLNFDFKTNDFFITKM